MTDRFQERGISEQFDAAQAGTTMFDRALALWDMGFHVIPLGSPLDPPGNMPPDQWPKMPRIAWAQYQNRQPTEEEVRQWWTHWPNANIAIITGIQFDVIDADSQEAVEWCRSGAITRTPWENHTGRGVQFLYRKTDLDVRNSANASTKIDTRGIGGYIVAPGSTHANGKTYKFVGDPEFLVMSWEELPALTPDDLAALGASDTDSANTLLKSNFLIDTSKAILPLDLSGVPEGGRNNKAASLAGRWINDGLEDQEILARMERWNQSNEPPLSDTELERTLKSVRQTDLRNNPVDQSLNSPGQSQNSNYDSWQPLVPLDDVELPTIKTSGLPSVLGNFIQALTAATETPPELALGMTLAACSTALARSVKVRVEPGYYEPPNVWILAALPPGTRKSAVQSAATLPLIEWQTEQNEFMQPEIARLTSERKTLVARAEALRKKAATNKDPSLAEEQLREVAEIETCLPEVPSSPKLWTSDATPERLGTMLADHDECMAWLSSEGGLFDMFEGRYSGGIPNLDLLLKSHSGDPDRVDRGSRPSVDLRYPRLTIGISPQPDVLRGLASKRGFRGRGLLARFLYLLPSSPLGYRTLKTKPVPSGIKTDYEETVRNMLKWTPWTDEQGRENSHIVRLSPSAHSAWKEFAHVVEKGMRPGEELEFMLDWAGKAPGAAARLANILHCIEHASNGQAAWDYEISCSTMEAALDLMAVFTKHSMAALGLMGADPALTAAGCIWEWVGRLRLPVFTISEAFNALKGRFQRVQQVKDALGVLEERGYVEVLNQQNTGRPGRPPSPPVVVRPEFVEAWR